MAFCGNNTFAMAGVFLRLSCEDADREIYTRDSEGGDWGDAAATSWGAPRTVGNHQRLE